METESIAVIAWAESLDQDFKYLVDGISEGITRRLALIPKLRVAAWTMVRRFQTPGQFVAHGMKGVTAPRARVT